MRLCLLLQNDIRRSLVLPKPFERRRTQQAIVSPSAVFDHAYKPRLGPPYPFVGCGRQLLAEVWLNGMSLLYIVAERSGLAGGPARSDATCIDELFTIIIAERYRADRSAGLTVNDARLGARKAGSRPFRAPGILLISGDSAFRILGTLVRARLSSRNFARSASHVIHPIACIRTLTHYDAHLVVALRQSWPL